MTADGAIIARVEEDPFVPTAIKTGLMIRETLSPNAPNAFMSLFSNVVGLFQSRAVAGAGTSSSSARPVCFGFGVKGRQHVHRLHLQ